MALQGKSISVLVVAYNEDRSVHKVLAKLRTLTYPDEIVCVDNGSTDRTLSLLEEAQRQDHRIRIVKIPKNKGFGHGFATGIQNTKCDIVARQDADLEYDPLELESVIDPIAQGLCQVVYGSRMLVRKAHKAQYYYNYLANVLFTVLADLLANMNLTDVETASKVFDGNLVRQIPLTTKGFQIEIEFLFKLRSTGCAFYEVPISYYGRSVAEGKKIRLKDAFTTLYAMFRYGFFWKFYNYKLK